MPNPGYLLYMRSAAWHRRRNRAIKRAETRCEYVDSQGKRCWIHSCLMVHHLTYVRFGHEKQADLQVLCSDHHAVAELMKLYKGLVPTFSSDAEALKHWKIFSRKYPKDWAKALTEAAKAATKNDKGGVT